MAKRLGFLNVPVNKWVQLSVMDHSINVLSTQNLYTKAPMMCGLKQNKTPMICILEKAPKICTQKHPMFVDLITVEKNS